MRTTRPTLRTVALLVGLTLITSCGSPVPPENPGSATIGPTGGSVSAVGSDGTTYRVTFAAGALREATDVSLVPLPGDVAAFSISPPGLVLAVPAQVRIVLPGPDPADEDSVFKVDGDTGSTFVPTTLAGPELTTQLSFFRLPSHGSGLISPAQATDGDAVSVVTANCLQRLESLDGSYGALLATNSFEAALRVILGASTLGANCALTAEVSEWFERIPDPACARFEDLVLLARVTAADDFDIFNELSQPLLNWEATLQELGVECAGAPSAAQVIGEKTSQYITFYSGKVNGSGFPSDFDGLLNEARKLLTLRGQAEALGLPGVESQVKSQVMDPVMDLLRNRGFDECVAEEDHYYLYTLLMAPFTNKRIPIGTITPLDHHAGFTDADVATDIQYCLSQLTVEVWGGGDVPEELTDLRQVLGPGEDPGQQVDRVELRGPVTGHLVLRGPIDQLRCGQERTLVDHELVLRFAGQESHRVTSLDSNPEIDVEATVLSAGLEPKGLNTVDLTVRRESNACGGLYGSADYLLFTVGYEADPVPQVTSASSTPASIVAEQDVQLTFTLDWIDPGENLETMFVEYRLGDASASVVVDLASDQDATGFDGKQGAGQYTASHFVYCSEQGKGPMVARFVLEDDYGQRSEAGEVSIPISYAGCGQVAAPTAESAVSNPRATIVMGVPR